MTPYILHTSVGNITEYIVFSLAGWANSINSM